MRSKHHDPTHRPPGMRVATERGVQRVLTSLVGVLAGLTLAVTMGAAPHAQAADVSSDATNAVPDSGHPATVTAVKDGEVADTEASSGLLDTIACEIKAHNPHKSSHVPGSINTSATLSCSSNVSALSMSVSLWREDPGVGWRVVQTGSNSNAGRNVLQASSGGFVACETGKFYQGTAAGTITFPPGYSPPTAVVADDTDLISFPTCP